MESKFTYEAVRPDLDRVLGLKEVVTDRINVQEAWFILQACQLTMTHPKLGRPVKDRMLALGRRMQELIAPFVGPLFREFMEAGWHREIDE